MAAKTLEQRAAAADAKARKLRHLLSERKRSDENHRKFVIGGAMLAAIRNDDEFRARFVDQLRQHVRDVEKHAVADLLGEGTANGTAFSRGDHQPG